MRAPTLLEFLQQFGGAYFSTEGALWRTLALLFWRPGELTRRYLAGQRKHYVLPLRLFLTVSVLALLVLRGAAMVGATGPATVHVQLDEGRNLTLDLGRGRAGLKDGQFFCTGLPAWMCQRLQRRIDTDEQGLRQQMGQVGERMLAQLGSGMFVVLPAFALWLKLAWVDRRLRYTEHLVLALHLHAFWFLVLLLVLPDWKPLTTVATLALPVHTLLAFRRVYGGRFIGRLLRASVVALLYLVTLALVTVGLALWALLA